MGVRMKLFETVGGIAVVESLNGVTITQDDEMGGEQQSVYIPYALVQMVCDEAIKVCQTGWKI